MEIRYHKWFSLEVVHYYDLGGFDAISLQPTKETAMILRNSNVRMARNKGRFDFYIGRGPNEDDILSIVETLGVLTFEVTCTDPLFYNYTDIPRPGTDETLLFYNTSDSSELEIASIVPEERTRENGIGMLQIHPEALSTENLSLTFMPLAVFYQYHIVIADPGKIEITDLVIVDSNVEKYLGPVEGTLNNGQIAQVFTSQSPIPLLKKMTDPPKLIGRYNNSSSGDNKLEMNLPNPSPENLRIEEDGRLIGSVYVYV